MVLLCSGEWLEVCVLVYCWCGVLGSLVMLWLFVVIKLVEELLC